jgi:demethylmenaquinone methyltransferase/2-methoxy-6-polyprenyl-1,4-benzoquinol methylase
MFSDIAPRYDLLNHLLSLNIDKWWRGVAVRELAWSRRPDGVFVDLCAGTLDVGGRLASQAGFRGLVVGADFSEAMLRSGEGKGPRAHLVPTVADALALPLGDDSAAGAIVAFGIRNLADLSAGLREVVRVLEPGGRFVILECGTPKSALVRAGYHAYFRHVLPAVGRLVSGHATAYRYLPESVANFPEEDVLAGLMRDAGFIDVRWRSLTLGIVAIHVGEKPATQWR